jgi:hypothetical protein
MTDHHTAWRISGGSVEVLTLPPHSEWYYVPEGITSMAIDTRELAPVCLIPGPHEANYEHFSLPIVIDIATRITPWAVWYCAPAFFDSHAYGAAAWGASEVAICKTNLAPAHAAEAAFHEAWHIAEALIRDDLLRSLDARLATGPDWPGETYPRRVERRARAFEAFSRMMVEGCRMTVRGPAVPIEIQVFWLVLSGNLGREIMAHRAPKKPGIPSRVRGLLVG